MGFKIGQYKNIKHSGNMEKKICRYRKQLCSIKKSQINAVNKSVAMILNELDFYFGTLCHFYKYLIIHPLESGGIHYTTLKIKATNLLGSQHTH